MVADADGLAASSVIPRSDSDRTWPRSTVSVPVQPDVHQSVPALPSMAFGAGFADSAVVEVAVPSSAQFTVGAACPAFCVGALAGAVPAIGVVVPARDHGPGRMTVATASGSATRTAPAPYLERPASREKGHGVASKVRRY